MTTKQTSQLVRRLDEFIVDLATTEFRFGCLRPLDPADTYPRPFECPAYAIFNSANHMRFSLCSPSDLDFDFCRKRIDALIHFYTDEYLLPTSRYPHDAWLTLRRLAHVLSDIQPARQIRGFSFGITRQIVDSPVFRDEPVSSLFV